MLACEAREFVDAHSAGSMTSRASWNVSIPIALKDQFTIRVTNVGLVAALLWVSELVAWKVSKVIHDFFTNGRIAKLFRHALHDYVLSFATKEEFYLGVEIIRVQTSNHRRNVWLTHAILAVTTAAHAGFFRNRRGACAHCGCQQTGRHHR